MHILADTSIPYGVLGILVLILVILMIVYFIRRL